MSLHGRKSILRKKANRGFHGYPVATIAFYGPGESVATKVAVGIVAKEGGEPVALERWISEGSDVRNDPSVEAAVIEFIQSHAVRSIGMTDALLGCPHEEGIDYPEGASCPSCPYWAGRDRFTKERIQ